EPYDLCPHVQIKEVRAVLGPVAVLVAANHLERAGPVSLSQVLVQLEVDKAIECACSAQPVWACKTVARGAVSRTATRPRLAACARAEEIDDPVAVGAADISSQRKACVGDGVKRRAQLVLHCECIR